MNRWMQQMLVTGMAGIMALSLAACGSPSEESSVADLPPEPLTFSEALQEHKLWYMSKYEPGKDVSIESILVVDGDTITMYRVSESGYMCEESDTSYADLKGLTDEEIIELAKEKSEIYAENNKHSLFYEGSVFTDTYSLIVNTDETGNNVVSETLVYEPAELLGKELVPSESYVVYDNTFAGYENYRVYSTGSLLFTRIEEGQPLFQLDSMDTEGIEVN